MKNFIKIILVSLILALGIGLIMYYTSGNAAFNENVKKENNTYSLDETKQQDLNNNDFKKISVSSSFTDINIIPEDRDNIKIHYYGKVKCNSLDKSQNPIHKLVISNINNILIVKTEKSQLHSNLNLYFKSYLKLDIFVPKAYKNNIDITTSSGNIKVENSKLNSLAVKTSSGDTTLDLITAKNINLSSSSGNFICNNLKADDFRTESSSGDLKGNNIAAASSNFSSSSGNFICDNLITDETYGETSSGDIKIHDYTGSLNLSSTSGDIFTEFSKYDNDISIETSSGDVTLQLPPSSQFYLNSECSSGDISCDFPITIEEKHEDNKLQGTVKSNKNKISIDTSSGNISIKNK